MSILNRYPVIVLDVCKFLLAGGTAVGWWDAPASMPVDIATAVAAVAFAGLTWATHASVSPVETGDQKGSA